MREQALRVLVVDDEPLALEGMAAFVRSDEQLVVCAECPDGESAVEAIHELKPDLVLLDIQMPGLDGFGVIRTIGAEAMPTVVFVTAYDQHALHAFDVHAVDYVLKPFSDERLRRALAQAKERIRDRSLRAASAKLLALLLPDVEPTRQTVTEAPTGNSYIRRLPVRHNGGVLYINVNDIEWIEGADYYARVHARKRALLVRETLTVLREQLDPARFFRTHRSAVINLDYVVELQPMFRGEAVVILQSGAKVRVARPRRHALERALERGVGG